GLLAQFGKAVPLDETPRGGGRRLGRLGETVPAPEVPFPRDEPLSGLQKRAEPLAFLASDDADLLQTTLHRRRHLNEIAQPLRPRGQRDVSPVSAQWSGAAGSADASRSSPSAAPSAVSKPLATTISSTTGVQRSSAPALRSFSSVRDSASSR